MASDVKTIPSIPDEKDDFAPVNREGAVIPDHAAEPRCQRGDDGWPCFGTEGTGRATIMIAGNLMCQDRVVEAKKTEGPEEDYEFDSCFSRLKPLLESADLTIGNLEGVVHPEAPYANEQHFLRDSRNLNAPPQFLAALRNAGFDLLTTANEHCMDTGLCGLARTYDYLESFGFLHTGSFTDRDEPRYALAKVNGIRIGVVAYSLVSNREPKKGRDWMIGTYRADQAWRDIWAARAAGAEFVICCIHWGPEDKHDVLRVQRRLARELADLGADYVVGSHPHVLQPYETFRLEDGRTVPVAFSLGNLLCQNQARLQRTGIILQLELERDGEGRIVVRDSCIPCLTRLNYRDVTYTVLPLTESCFAEKDMTALAWERSKFVADVVGPALPNAVCQPPASSGEEPVLIWDPSVIPEQIGYQEDFLRYARLSESFRRLYADYMVDVMADNSMVQHAINRCREFTKDPTADLKTYRELIGDMVYSRNVLGFYYYEYFVYGLADKTPAERLDFTQESMCMNYYSKLNTDRKSIRILNEKFASYRLFKDFYKREIVLIEGKKGKESFLDYCERHTNFIVKPKNGSMGQGVRVIRQTSADGRDRLFDELLAEYDSNGRSEFLCEELILSHPALAQIHPQSVNTLRVFSYNNGEEVKVVVAWLKAGQGSAIVDNGSAGGMIAAIDCETGQVITDARDEANHHYVAHPDTGFVFKGFRIPQWEAAVAAVKEMAVRLPKLRLIGWDIALSMNRGWQVVEGNAHGMFFLVQVATQKGMRPEFEKAIEWERWRFGAEEAPV